METHSFFLLYHSSPSIQHILKAYMSYFDFTRVRLEDAFRQVNGCNMDGFRQLLFNYILLGKKICVNLLSLYL
jgi:hypothetical protein